MPTGNWHSFICPHSALTDIGVGPITEASTRRTCVDTQTGSAQQIALRLTGRSMHRRMSARSRPTVRGWSLIDRFWIIISIRVFRLIRASDLLVMAGVVILVQLARFSFSPATYSHRLSLYTLAGIALARTKSLYSPTCRFAMNSTWHPYKHANSCIRSHWD